MPAQNRGHETTPGGCAAVSEEATPAIPASPDDVDARVETALGEVRAELLRVDGKASTLLALAGVALSVGLAVLGRTRLPLPALLAAGLTVALLGAGVVLLAAAVRPKLAGDFGFVRYANAGDVQTLLGELTGRAALVDRASELHWMSVAVYGKYRHVHRAVTLLLAGLATAAATALLALLLA